MLLKSPKRGETAIQQFIGDRDRQFLPKDKAWGTAFVQSVSKGTNWVTLRQHMYDYDHTSIMQSEACVSPIRSWELIIVYLLQNFYTKRWAASTLTTSFLQEGRSTFGAVEVISKMNKNRVLNKSTPDILLSSSQNALRTMYHRVVYWIRPQNSGWNKIHACRTRRTRTKHFSASILLVFQVGPSGLVATAVSNFVGHG